MSAATALAILTHPAVAPLVLEAAKLVVAELNLGKYDDLPADEHKRLVDAADALDEERKRLRPHGSD